MYESYLYSDRKVTVYFHNGGRAVIEPGEALVIVNEEELPKVQPFRYWPCKVVNARQICYIKVEDREESNDED